MFYLTILLSFICCSETPNQSDENVTNQGIDTCERFAGNPNEQRRTCCECDVDSQSIYDLINEVGLSQGAMDHFVQTYAGEENDLVRSLRTSMTTTMKTLLVIVKNHMRFNNFSSHNKEDDSDSSIEQETPECSETQNEGHCSSKNSAEESPKIVTKKPEQTENKNSEDENELKEESNLMEVEEPLIENPVKAPQLLQNPNEIDVKKEDFQDKTEQEILEMYETKLDEALKSSFQMTYSATQLSDMIGRLEQRIEYEIRELDDNSKHRTKKQILFWKILILLYQRHGIAPRKLLILKTVLII